MKDDLPQDQKTKFETDLEQFFPDIYKAHTYGRLDPKIWKVIYRMTEYFDAKTFGKIEISYQAGRINSIITSVKEERD